MKIKNKILTLAIIIGMMSAVSCGEDTATESSSSEATSSATLVETEESTEITTAEETEVVTKEEAETSVESTEVTETSEESKGEVLKNSELLSLINNQFGMTSDGTFEGDVATAKMWDVIDEDAVINPDEPITAELLITATMRATGLVTGEDSVEDIVNFAVEKKVIESNDLSSVDVTKASDIIKRAYDAWIGQDFENEINVEFAEGVVDMTGKISASDVKIEGDSITIPSDAASEISDGTVFIVPDPTGVNSAGTAYVAGGFTDNGDGTITISSSPADFMQVYGSIDGQFGVN